MSEATLMRRVMLAASRFARVFRNNTGVATFPNGSRVRYGLCVGSSDIIGWTPVTHAGRTFAVFTAIEVKTASGRLTDRQLNFLDRVASDGGIAIVARDANDATRILEQVTTGETSTGRVYGEVSASR